MTARKIKGQHHTGRRFLRVPLSLCSFVPSCLRGPQSFLQNKANVKMGKINISTAILTAYANKRRTINNEHYSKQTQSNPISYDQSQVKAKSKPISKWVI